MSKPGETYDPQFFYLTPEQEKEIREYIVRIGVIFNGPRWNPFKNKSPEEACEHATIWNFIKDFDLRLINIENEIKKLRKNFDE